MTTDGMMIGPYRRLERLGEGAMGEVHRAVDTMLERDVALKTLRPEMSAREDLVERFRVEAIALARLHHRHIATVYAFFRHGEQHHIAMQYLRGRTLEQVLRERGRLRWREAAAVAIDVASALEHAHALGVVHRDLKPANLMVDDEGRTVVMDFGIARVLAKERQTRAGTLVGTLEYIAPEVVRGEAADARSDLYALGCVLYEMVTGELPFPGRSDFELMRAHAEQVPPSPRERIGELPEALEAVILRALAKQPGARFADAAAFRKALQAALNAATQAAQASRWPAWLALPRPAQAHAWTAWLREYPGLAGVALVAAGAVCLPLAWSALSWNPPAAPPSSAAPPVTVAAPTTTVATYASAPPTPSPAAPAATRPATGFKPVVVESPVESPRESRPAQPGPVFVMPPPPQARVSVETRAPTPVPPTAPTPKPATPADAGGGWYVRH
ncbi:MAG: serine/threonine protein kinase [Rubrivivax sp.]|nr:serine/threonine protein kinase [Rubrivivax sp.]